MIANHRGVPMVADHGLLPMIADHRGLPMVPDHGLLPVVSNHRTVPMIPDHGVIRLCRAAERDKPGGEHGRNGRSCQAGGPRAVRHDSLLREADRVSSSGVPDLVYAPPHTS
jgi:hypothetical protein